jgi:hypothetical protein
MSKGKKKSRVRRKPRKNKIQKKDLKPASMDRVKTVATLTLDLIKIMATLTPLIAALIKILIGFSLPGSFCT